MKQLLFLLLFPCLCVAQYTGNGNQKISLGEQTTADGLVYRGLAADTTRKPSVDTMAYILLDTNTNIIWQYKKATSNAWTRVGGSISSGVTGTLPVANGGTGTSTAFTAGSVVFAGASGTYTQDNSGLFYNSTNDYLGVATASPNYKFHVKTGESGRTNHDSRMKIQIESELEAYYSINVPSGGYGGFRVHTTESAAASAVFEYWAPNKKFYFLTGGFYEFNDKNNNKLLTIDSTGFVGINQVTPTERLHVVGNARITGAYSVTTGSAANVFVTTDGVLQRSTSSIKYKTDVEDYSKGLKEVMQLRPVTFKSINSNNDKTYAGFIAEELADLKLNELVENNDSGEPDAISYAYMVTLLTKAIQEQQEQISLLKKRLLILENK